MFRVLTIGFLALVLVGCVPIGPDLGGSSAPLNLVPDPDYQARVGDRCVLYGVEHGSPMESIPILLDVTAHDKYERLRQSVASVDLADLEERKELQWTPSGTRVLVLAICDRSHTGSRLVAEVRLLDGPHKNRNLWTPVEYVVQLKAAPPE